MEAIYKHKQTGATQIMSENTQTILGGDSVWEFVEEFQPQQEIEEQPVYYKSLFQSLASQVSPETLEQVLKNFQETAKNTVPLGQPIPQSEPVSEQPPRVRPVEAPTASQEPVQKVEEPKVQEATKQPSKKATTLDELNNEQQV